VDGIVEARSVIGDGRFRGKVRSEVINLIHPAREGSKAELLLSGVRGADFWRLLCNEPFAIIN